MLMSAAPFCSSFRLSFDGSPCPAHGITPSPFLTALIPIALQNIIPHHLACHRFIMLWHCSALYVSLRLATLRATRHSFHQRYAEPLSRVSEKTSLTSTSCSRPKSKSIPFYDILPFSPRCLVSANSSGSHPRPYWLPANCLLMVYRYSLYRRNIDIYFVSPLPNFCSTPVQLSMFVLPQTPFWALHPRCRSADNPPVSHLVPSHLHVNLRNKAVGLALYHL